MLDKQPRTVKKGTAKQSRIKGRTRADISLWPSRLVRQRTDIKLWPSAFVRTGINIKLQPIGLVRSYKD